MFLTLELSNIIGWNERRRGLKSQMTPTIYTNMKLGEPSSTRLTHHNYTIKGSMIFRTDILAHVIVRKFKEKNIECLIYVISFRLIL